MHGSAAVIRTTAIGASSPTASASGISLATARPPLAKRNSAGFGQIISGSRICGTRL